MIMLDSDVSEMLARVMSNAHLAVPNSPDDQAAERKTVDSGDRDGIQEWRLPGIFGKTCVTTNFGQVPAQLLRVGDRVRTRSGRYLPIKGIRETKLDKQFIERHPRARPVLVSKGALGPDLPMNDVILSPAQEVTLPARLAKVPVTRARDLSEKLQGVDQALGIVAYFELQLDSEEDVCCEGIWIKSASL